MNTCEQARGVCKIFIRPDYNKRLRNSIPQNQQSLTNQYTNHTSTDSCVWIQHVNFDTLASSHYIQSIIKIVTVPWTSKEYFQDQMMQTWQYLKWHHKHIKLSCVLNRRLLQNFADWEKYSLLRLQFLLGFHSLKQLLNTTYIKTQYRKNFAAHFVLLTKSQACSQTVGQLEDDNLAGFEKKQMPIAQACSLNCRTTYEWQPKKDLWRNSHALISRMSGIFNLSRFYN